MRSVLTWVGIVLAFVMVCVLGLFLTFEWWAKGIIARQASATLGRRVIIAGDLDVKWSWTPHITVERLRLANTAWGAQPYMGTLRRLAVQIDLREILRGRVVLPMIEILEPVMRLESSAKGIPNWLFLVARGDTAPQTDKATAEYTLPTIGQVIIRNGDVAYHDYSTDTKITGRVTELTATTTGPEQTVEVRGAGQFAEWPFELTVLAGALSTIQDDAPYPVQTQVRLGEWQVTLKGTLTHPLQLAGVDLDVTFEGLPADAATPDTDTRPASEPHYRLAGHLTRQGDAWVLEALSGSVGTSDLAGRVALSMPGVRPFIEANLTSHSLDIDAMITALTDRHNHTEQDTSEPDSESSDPVIDLQVTRAVNGLLSFQGDTVKVSKQTLQDVTAKAQLRDGLLTLQPRFAFAGGTIDATVEVEDREGPLHSAILASIRRLQVEQLLPTRANASALTGIVNGAADLVISGRTVSELIASIHGKAALTMRDTQHDTDVAVEFATFEGPAKAAGREVHLTGQGRLRGQPLRLEGRAGSLYALHAGENPYPIQVSFQLGETHAQLDGTVSEPWQFTGLKANVAFKGPDPARLSPLLPFALPHFPPYQFEGHLQRAGHSWAMQDFKGTIGRSDVAGTLVVDTSDQRLFLRGDLQSQLLQVDELTAAMSQPQEQATPPTRTADKAGNRQVIPNIAIDPALLRLLDAELRFRGKRIRGIKLPLSDISTTIQMHRGNLTLSPTMGLGGGTLRAEIEVVGRHNPVKSAVNATFDQVDLREVLRQLANTPAAFGKLDGRIALIGIGSSLDAFLESMDGDVSLTMAGGHLDSLMIELVGLDVGEAIVIALVDPKDKVPIRCLLADFMVSDGKLQTQLLLFDTADTKIVGEGSIDIGKEVIDLKLEPRAKDLSLFSAEAPLYITGSFSDISAKPKLGEVLLSLAVPIKPGTKEDAACQGLRDLVQQQRQPSQP